MSKRETATYSCPSCRRKVRTLADEAGDHGCICGFFPGASGDENEGDGRRVSVKMTQKQFIGLWREEEIEVDGQTFKTVEVGDWDGAGEKYQTLEVIITDGERFYSGEISKSGSYFTDWHYDDYGAADLTEVRKVTRTITREVWEAV